MRRVTSWFCAERSASAKSRKSHSILGSYSPVCLSPAPAAIPPGRDFLYFSIFLIIFALIIELFYLLKNYLVFFSKKACIFLWLCYNKSRSGGLAQLVRAPASHAGGLGFESLVLHHKPQLLSRLWLFVFVLQSTFGRASSPTGMLCLFLCHLTFKLPPKPAGLLGACRFSGGYSAFLSSVCYTVFKAIPHHSKRRYGERGAADAKPKAQIILCAALDGTAVKVFYCKPCGKFIIGQEDLRL